MAKSLDQLIAFLLEEIALNGDTGISFAAIVQHTSDFYTQRTSSESEPRPAFTVDAAFVKKLWQWLTRLEDIEVLPDKQFKDWSYSRLEAHFTNPSNASFDDGSSDIDQRTASSSFTSSSTLVPPELKDVRLVATVERIYQAICGHGPDPSKVFPSEFALLCTIAAARYDGILQGELGRITGQDKRSVPKRTDVLQEKGYVEKRQVFVGGHKTSRLFLQRFSSRPSQNSADAMQYSQTLRDFARQIFAVLQQDTLSTLDELATSLSITDPAKKRLLQQVIRAFVQLKCLKRVRVAGGQGSAASDIKTCVQLLHEPTEIEYTSAHDDYQPTSSITDAIALAQSNASLDDDAENEATSDAEEEDLIDVTSFQEVPIPQWNPHRNLTNSLFDIIHNSGQKGCSNIQARQELTGLTVRRPIESTLTRVSHGSLTAQPAAVKDLAIVRNWEVHDSTGKFVHRSFGQYEAMVRRGDTVWSAVQGYKKANDPDRRDNGNSFMVSLSRDAHGLVAGNPPKGQLRTADKCIDTIATATTASNHHVRADEPVIAMREDGSFEVGWKATDETFNTVDSPKSGKQSRTRSKAVRQLGPSGRPRKFVRGTEKFWQEMFINKYNELHPDNKTHSTAGLPHDSDCQKMFRERPAEMDDMILKVIDHGLPTPARSSDISQAWIDRMKAFFARATSDAVFVTSGMRRISHRRKSCVMTVRSSRLTELNLVNAKIFSTLVSNTRHTAETRIRSEGQGDTANATAPSSETITSIIECSDPAGHGVRTTSHTVPNTGSPPISLSEQVPFQNKQTPEGQQILTLDNRSPCEDAVIELRKTRGRKRRAVDGAGSTQASSDSAKKKRTKTQPSHEIAHTETVVSQTATCDRNHVNPQDPKHKHSVEYQDGTETRGPTVHASSDPSNVATAPVGRKSDSPRSTKTSSVPSAVTAFPASAQASSEVTHEPDLFASEPSLHHQSKPFGEAVGMALRQDKMRLMAHDAGSDQPYNVDEIANGTGPDSVPSADLLHNMRVSGEEYLPLRQTVLPNTLQDEARNDVSISETQAPLLSTNADSDTPSKSPTSLGQPATSVQSSIAQTRGEILPIGERSTPTKTTVEGGRLHTTPSATSRARRTTSKTPTSTQASDAQTVEGLDNNAFETIRTQLLVGRDAAEYYRSFLMELIHLCGGLVPHNSSMMKRAMRVKCLETVCDPDMNIKLIKTGINLLERAKKLKVMHFAYQRNGFSHMKAIVALPHILPTDPQFRALQEKIVSLPYQEDYVPPELQAEIDRQPRRSERRDPLLEPAWSISAAPSKKSKTKTQAESSEIPAPRTRQPSVRESERQAVDISDSAHISFLTLKVPRIGEIKAVVNPTSRSFILVDDATINIDIEHRGVADSIIFDGSSLQKKDSRKPTTLPKSLKAILQQEQQEGVQEVLNDEDYALRIFGRNIDLVAIWEQKNLEATYIRKAQTWNFINHFTPASDTTPTQRHEANKFLMVTFVKGQHVERDAPRVVSWPEFAKLGKSKRKKRKRALTPENSDEDAHRFSDSEPEIVADNDGPRKRGRATGNGRKPKQTKAKDTKGKKRARFNPRGIGMRHLPQEHAHRLGVTFALVRVLNGGIDRHLDFGLLKRLIPEESESMLKERWRVFSNYYNNDMDALIEDFQIKYLDALADARVPTVDFDELEQTDWEGIQKWALQNINTKSKDIFRGLPPTREEFLELNEIEVPEINTMRNFWNVSVAYTMVQKEEAWCNAVLGTSPSTKLLKNVKPFATAFATEEMEQEEILAIARSWILATVLTSRTAYNARATRDKLRSIAKDEARCEEILDTATKRLQGDKIINRSEGTNDPVAVAPDGSVLVDSRGWRISSKFFDKLHLNRTITSSMLKAAGRFKLECIDPAVAQGDHFPIPKDPALTDGISVAIHNLIAMDMLRVRPGKDVPASRYGLDHENEGYKTRAMDKMVLSFSTHLESTSAYQMGNMALEGVRSTHIPRGGIDAEDGLGRIPVWFNINHDFMPAVWEMAIGAVIGIVSVRPGVTSIEIVRTLAWALSVYDVDLVLQYLLDCAFVAKVYDGWETMPWWWMCIDGSQPETIAESSSAPTIGHEGMRTRSGMIVPDSSTYV